MQNFDPTKIRKHAARLNQFWWRWEPIAIKTVLGLLTLYLVWQAAAAVRQLAQLVPFWIPLGVE